MKDSKNIPLINDQFDANVFFHIVKKTKWILLLIVILISFISAIYLRYAPRLYESSTIIQINQENSSTKILGVENAYEEDQLAQIVELLKSKKFISRTLARLPLKLSYYTKGIFLSEEMYKHSPINVTYKITKSSVYGQDIYFNYIDRTKFELIHFVGDEEIKYIGKYGDWVHISGADLKVNLLDVKPFVSTEALFNDKFFFRLNSPSQSLLKYISNLTISVKNYGARTIEISCKGKNALKTSEMTNTIAQTYLEYEIEKKKASSKSVIEFIDSQTSKVFKTLNSTEKDILNFKKSNDIKDYGAANIQPVGIFMEKINEFQDAILNADIEISSLKQIDKELNKNDDINTFELIALISGTTSQNIVSGILTKLQDLLTEKEELLNDVTTNNHRIQVIDKQFDNQKEILKEFIITTIHRLETRKESYTKKISEYEGKIFKESDYNEIELSRMERYYAIQDKFYQKLIEKKAEYLISQAGYVSKNTILESANVPSVPVSPNQKIVIIFSFFIILVISITTLLLRYIFYNELSSVQELEFYTKIPIIGSVPLIEMKNKYSQLIVQKEMNAIVTESFRTIRSNLDFYNLNKKGSLIVVTSTVSGEGKTFVAINLAGILAMRGKQVIIVDLDLRKPKIHHSLGVENNEGMSRVLSGHTKLKDVIHNTDIETLDYITADITPPNPSELISGDAMKSVLTELKEIYDYVIIDTSPIGLVADSIHLFKQADLPLYILKANYSKRRFVYNLDFLQNKKGINHINIILNGINMNMNKNSYQYGYGYGYGYYESTHQKKSWIRKLFFQK